MKKPKFTTEARKKQIEELYKRYGSPQSSCSIFRYAWKKFAWLFIVRGSHFLKRLLDIFGSAITLIILSPLLLLIVVAIKLSDRGDVFYITDRVGKWGELFRFPKFRTMVVGAEDMKNQLLHHSEEDGLKRFKLPSDPRITTIGRWLRKSSFDELPQLWTVLKGDMSLVGPRPPLPEEVEHYTTEERSRLDVKPGLTCFWQVSGRSMISFDEQVKLDIKYIESQSLLLDIKILLKTIPAVLFGKGAY